MITVRGMLIFLITLAFLHLAATETPEEWIKRGQEELARALKVLPIVKRPKNVVFFLGDGMGISTLTAARIYKGQMAKKPGEEGALFFEQFPHVGLSKTYNDNLQVPDSAGSATAFFTGQKAAEGVLGVNSYAKLGNCSSAQGNSITSILEWAQKAGKATGIVTTARITHATPAGAYAHCPHRDWEYEVPAAKEDELPDNRSLCRDMALQMIEDEPGKSINVIFGGGRRGLWPKGVPDPQSKLPKDESVPVGSRPDGRNLIADWLKRKTAEGHGAKSKVVATSTELDALKPDTTDYVLGLFAHSHMEYDLQREAIAPQQPTLKQMVTKAIELLSKHKNGFFLVVEGGRIDHAHHDGLAKLALHDTVALDAAIQAAVEMLPADDTLTIVTADHSHTLTIGGYPERGTNILKGSDYLADDRLPFLTLSYASGPGAVKSYPRRNLTGEETDNDKFLQDALVPLESETHGGEDVAIYATGPFAHLFHSLHEQNYIPVAIDYAACYRSNDADHCKAGSNSDDSNGSAFIAQRIGPLLFINLMFLHVYFRV